MLQPKRTKYRKQFKGKNYGLATRGSSVAFGDFGLKATERARMTAREIEAARRAMARHVKRGGQIWIRVFPDVPITKKPLEVRMGSGKGNVEYWVAKVKPGTAQRAELLKLRKEQFALRLQRATGQAVKPDQFGKVRKSIARLKTAMRAQELGLPSGA